MNIQALWNSQVDHQNQWDSLGEDEKLEFAMAHEREECAELCQRFSDRMMSAGECADAIRARGKA
jgi:hypothetical protein